MKKTVEQEVVVKATEGTKITRANLKIAEDGSVVEIHIISEVVEDPVSKENAKVSTDTSTDNFDELFPIVEASKLSLEDAFMKYEPKRFNERRLKHSLITLIKLGLSDFRRPRMDPSEDEDGNIVFEKGKMPAVNYSANWWDKKASEFMPAKNSRLGIEKEYDAFLGVLIKELVENEKYKIADAWHDVCHHSEALGHYCFSKEYKCALEPTGSRQVGRWFDLANTRKILKNYKADSFLLASGNFTDIGCNSPLANLDNSHNVDKGYFYGVGWIVFDV